jgi:CDP-paratose 2-epimerase
MKTSLVTHSAGLIDSEVCQYFATEFGYTVHGIDNNQRTALLGSQCDTLWSRR